MNFAEYIQKIRKRTWDKRTNREPEKSLQNEPTELLTEEPFPGITLHGCRPYTTIYDEYTSDAYNLPVDTIYYLESSWNYIQNDFVRSKMEDMERYINRYIAAPKRQDFKPWQTENGFMPFRFVYVSRQDSALNESLRRLHPDLPEWNPTEEADKEAVYQIGRKDRTENPYNKVSFTARLFPTGEEGAYRFISCDTEMLDNDEILACICNFVSELQLLDRRILEGHSVPFESKIKKDTFCAYKACWEWKPLYESHVQLQLESYCAPSAAWMEEEDTTARKHHRGGGRFSVSPSSDRKYNLAEPSEEELERLRKEREEEERKLKEELERREMALREKAQQIKEQISELQRENGINILAEVLGEDFIAKLQNNKPEHVSRLRIDNRYHILLPDYDMEVQLSTLPKALYILFLRHPEGIDKNDMEDYRTELRTIYLTISGRDDVAAMNRSIDDLVAPCSDSLNQKVSRINAAFRQNLAENLADNYIIQGPRGEKKQVRVAKEAELPSELMFA